LGEGLTQEKGRNKTFPRRDSLGILFFRYLK